MPEQSRFTVRRASMAILLAATGFAALRFEVATLAPAWMRPDFFLDLYVLTLMLALAADHAAYVRRRRAFWVGFAVAGCAYAIGSLWWSDEAARLSIRYLLPWAVAPLGALPTTAELDRASLIHMAASAVLGVLVSCVGGLLCGTIALIAQSISRPCGWSRLSSPRMKTHTLTTDEH